MSWLFYSLLSILLTVTYGLISKKILTHSDTYHPTVYASVLFLTAALYAFIFYSLSGIQATDFKSFSNLYFVFLLILNVVFYTIAPSLYYRGLKQLPLSEAAIVMAFIGIFALIFGIIFRTETFILSRVIGAFFILLGIGFITFKRHQFTINKYFFYLLFATFFYALAAVTDNIIITQNFIPTLFFPVISFGIPGLILLLMNSNGIQQARLIFRSKKIFSGILLNGVFILVSFYAIFRAYESGGTPSQVNLVVSTETIITVLLAMIFLGERKRVWIKILAAVLSTIGIYLLS